MNIATQAQLDAAPLGEWHDLGPGEFVAHFGSEVFAYSGSRVHAHFGSTVHAYSGSTVHARSGSRVHALSGSTVHARSGSRVHALSGSTVDAYSGSEVHALSGSEVYAYSGSTVDAYSGSTVDAYSGSTVHARSGSRVHAYSGSRVHAHFGSEVYDWDDGKWVLRGSEGAEAPPRMPDVAVPGGAPVEPVPAPELFATKDEVDEWMNRARDEGYAEGWSEAKRESAPVPAPRLDEAILFAENNQRFFARTGQHSVSQEFETLKNILLRSTPPVGPQP